MQFTSCFESTVLVYLPTLLLLLLLPLDVVAFAHSSYRGVPSGIRFVRDQRGVAPAHCMLKPR